MPLRPTLYNAIVLFVAAGLWIALFDVMTGTVFEIKDFTDLEGMLILNILPIVLIAGGLFIMWFRYVRRGQFRTS